MKKKLTQLARIRKLMRENRHLLDLIDQAQWFTATSNSSNACPWCGNQEHWGHTSDCPVVLLKLHNHSNQEEQYKKEEDELNGEEK